MEIKSSIIISLNNMFHYVLERVFCIEVGFFISFFFALYPFKLPTYKNIIENIIGMEILTSINPLIIIKILFNL